MKGQKHLNVRGLNLSKFGHRASGIGNKSALLAALIVSVFSLVSWEQSQAQLYIHVYPNQDSTDQTLWIFSGSSSAASAGTLRTSINHSTAVFSS